MIGFPQIKTMFSDFKRNKDGNIAITTAVLGTLLGLAVGGAVDASGAMNSKSQLADHLDVAALTLVTSDLTDSDDLNDIAHEILIENGFEIPAGDLSAVMDANGEVTVSGTIKYATTFGGLIGRQYLDVSAKSSAIAGGASGGGGVTGPTDLVLVLDTTESMEGKKTTALKDAATDLIDSFSGSNGQIQVGMVPFSGYVNVGVQNRNASWIDVEDDETVTETYREEIVVAEGYCRGNPNGTVTSYEDGVPVNTVGCDDYVDPIYIEGKELTKTSEKTWEGCVLSRSKGNDATSTLHLTDDQYDDEKIQGKNTGDYMCADPIVPLTSQLASVSASINAIDPNWDTYMPAGIMWGRRVLSPQEPFTGGRTDAKQVMVLMTDGVNSMAKRGRSHGRVDITNAEDQERLEKTNEDTATLCQSAKDDGIALYTIAFEVKDNATKKMLENCASSSEFYFDAKSSNQLKDAFEEIGISVTEGSASAEVRITR